ncbi:MAG TPA: M28 family metallopeptidase [Flexilinea sp.]|nr:M28 family metallopeptidase [Flexilinea sp.]
MKAIKQKTRNPFLILLISFIGIGIAAGILLLTHLHTPSASREAVVEAMVETEMMQTNMAPTAVQKEITTPAPNQADAQQSPQTQIAAIDPAIYIENELSQENFKTVISQLSGAIPVTIDGLETRIETRYSYAMFSNQPNAKAKEFLLQTLRQWVPENQITVEPYVYVDGMGGNTWYNIIITFPGTVTPNEQILFTAHYDSCVVFEGDPMISAPGANDNGTGVAALLEAVRIFSTMKFERTLKVIFFSGEENFQQGSKAYAEQHAEDNITAVLNMDMFGTDKDGDRCFEMYVGELPGSQKIADLLLQTIQEYRLNLKADYLVSNAYAKADQKSFWDQNIPAITVMENFLPDYSPGGCEGVTDRTDYWHLPGDKIETINLEYAFDIGKAGILTILKLAGAMPVIPK